MEIIQYEVEDILAETFWSPSKYPEFYVDCSSFPEKIIIPDQKDNESENK